MLKKFLFLTIVSAFVLSLSHCSKKQVTDANVLEKQLEAADQEIGKMMNQMSDMGFQTQEQINELLSQFQKSTDKFEKYQLCSPILMARMSYQLRDKIKKEVPTLTQEQQKTVAEAEVHCQWATDTINTFEKTLSDADFKTMAEGVANSLLPYRKSLFASNQVCTQQEYTNLLKKDRELYTDTKVLGAALIMIAIQSDGNLKSYLPKYKERVEQSSFSDKDFILKFVDHAEKTTASPRNMEQKKDSLIRATQAFAEAGIKDIPKFLLQSISTAPNCFSSVRSGVVDIAKLVSTGDRMKTLHARVATEVQASGRLPADEKASVNPSLKELNPSFLQQLVNEKVSTRDKWFQPFYLSGDKTNFKVISAGKDRKPGTKDDLTYPNPQ